MKADEKFKKAAEALRQVDAERERLEVIEKEHERIKRLPGTYIKIPLMAPEYARKILLSGLATHAREAKNHIETLESQFNELMK